MADSFTTGIMVKMGLDPRGFARGMKEMKRDVLRFTAATKDVSKTVTRNLTGGIKNLGKTGAKAFGDIKNAVFSLKAAIATVGVGLLAKRLSDIASDADEIRSKYEVVFRGMEERADDAVESMRQRLGRSKQDLEEWTGKLQDTFVPLGFAREEAFKLSMTLTELGIDVASFNNAADPETIELFTSALVGNHEAVRRFGISITAAALDTELLQLGFKKATQGATEQQKVLARLSLMMKMTGDAQGDAERTADSFANTMKRVKATITDISVASGRQFNEWVLETIAGLGGVDGVAYLAETGMKSFMGVLESAKDLVKDVAGVMFAGEDQNTAYAKSLMAGALAARIMAQGLRMMLLPMIAATTTAKELVSAPGKWWDYWTADEDSPEFLDAVEELNESLDNIMDTSRAARDALITGAFDVKEAYDAMSAETAKTAEEMAEGVLKQFERMDFDMEAFAKSMEDDFRSSLKTVLQGFLDNATAEVESMQQANKEMEAYLKEREDAYKKHTGRLAKLDQERKASLRDFDESIFELGFENLEDPADKIQAIHRRITAIRTAANVAISADQFDDARDRLEEIADLIVRLSGEEKGSYVGLRQRELAELSAEMQMLYQRETEQQETLQREAEEDVKTLTQLQKEFAAEIAIAKQHQKDLAAEVKAVDKKPIVLLKDEYSNLADQIMRAAKAAAELNAQVKGKPAGSGAKEVGNAVPTQGGQHGGVAGSLGRKGPTDTTLAWLTPGEAVLSRKHTELLRPVLGQVGVPGFADGGPVDLKRRFRTLGALMPHLEAGQQQLQSLSQGIKGARARPLLTGPNPSTFYPGYRGNAALLQKHDLSMAMFGYEGAMSERQTNLRSRIRDLQRSGMLSGTGDVTGSYVPGFGDGGIVGSGRGSQTVNVGDVIVNLPATGQQLDGVEVARGARRAIQRGYFKNIGGSG